MMNLLRTQWLVALAAIVMLSGCGGDSLSVEYVEGVVTLDGTPIEGVVVTFSPVSETSGTPAVGTTDASGVYKLTAAKAGGAFGAGTTVGDYNVGFTKVSMGSGAADPQQEHEQALEKIEKAGGGMSAEIEVKNAIPGGYVNPMTSGIKASVKAGSNKGDAFNFDLKSDFTPTK